jgi:DNA replication protein DnaC
MNPQIMTTLRRLRLSGLASSLEVRLQEAQGNALSHMEFLELLIQDELTIRDDRSLKRRLNAASFKEPKTIEDFNFAFNPSINRKTVFDLAAGGYIRSHEDVLFMGPPGVGKSHLAQALGHQACRMGYHVLYRSIFDTVNDLIQAEVLSEKSPRLKKYLAPDLLIIDDMGLKRLPKHAGEHLFEIIMRRTEVKSTVMTSNRPLQDWGKLMEDIPTATAILDRFLSRAHIFEIKGKSYRLKDSAGKKEAGKGE